MARKAAGARGFRRSELDLEEAIPLVWNRHAFLLGWIARTDPTQLSVMAFKSGRTGQCLRFVSRMLVTTGWVAALCRFRQLSPPPTHKPSTAQNPACRRELLPFDRFQETVSVEIQAAR